MQREEQMAKLTLDRRYKESENELSPSSSAKESGCLVWGGGPMFTS